MRPAIAIVLLAGCSGLTGVSDGVVTLEVDSPISATLEVGETVRVVARAIDQNGTDVPGVIRWATPDTTVDVDAMTGDVTGRIAQGGLARVQASVPGRSGPLVSGFLTFTITARPDLLSILGDSVLTIPAGQTESAPLVTELRSRQPDGPLGGREIMFRITDPVFPTEAARTVEFNTGSLTATVTTSAAGTPATPVTLRLIPGTTPPDSARVVIDAVTATGAPVPGSGTRFRILFAKAP